MKKLQTYPSKVLLVGEYGVVVGGPGLTLPFHRFRATVRESGDVPHGKEMEAAMSLKYLGDIFEYIAGIPGERFHAAPDLDLFESQLEKYWLDVTIPTGYGLGSSGAVSAAIYDLFFKDSRSKNLVQQMEDLAAIESFFHGKSSGVDPLTCHASAPLFFQGDGTISKVTFNPSEIPGGYLIFLLDSGERFETGPLVKHFLKQMENTGFASSIRNEYIRLNLKLIEVILGIRKADPGLLFRAVSDYQFTHFRKMIPDRVIDVWIEGQVSNDYYLKLNGSGGGFLLGITHKTFRSHLEEKWNEKIIWIE